MKKITCLVIISLFCLTSLLPAVNSFYIENKINVLENSLDKAFQLPISNGWMEIFGGSSYDNGYSVQQTTDSGYIITGGTRSFGADLGDVWLIKTDSNGNKIWDKTYGEKDDSEVGFSVQQTTDGGYIFTGYSERPGGSQALLIKTDSNGDKVWDRTFGGVGFDYCYSVQQTTDGGYIITGETGFLDAPASDNDVWLIKTDSNGDKVWDRTFGGSSYDGGFSVQQTTDGGYIITGAANSFGAGDWDLWLIKTDSYGNEIWNKTFGGIDRDVGWSIRQTNDGGYIITGYTDSFGAGKEDFWLIKTDSYGNEAWNRAFGGIGYDRGHCVQQTKDGGYIIVGETWSFGAGFNDVWLIKTDSQGNANVTNEPPNTPTITGQTNGKAEEEYEYKFVSTDPNDDKVSYYVDWGDNSTTGWTRTLPSGEYYNSSHNWSEKGEYIIKAKAKDYYGVESNWATLAVSMPKNQVNHLLNNLLGRLLHYISFISIGGSKV